MFWITTPFGDTRAVVHRVKPEHPIMEVEELPEGHGVLHLINGKLTWSLPSSTEQAGTPELDSLKKENKLLKAQLQAQTERSDFIEDCIAEMATQVYGGV